MLCTVMLLFFSTAGGPSARIHAEESRSVPFHSQENAYDVEEPSFAEPSPVYGQVYRSGPLRVCSRVLPGRSRETRSPNSRRISATPGYIANHVRVSGRDFVLSEYQTREEIVKRIGKICSEMKESLEKPTPQHKKALRKRLLEAIRTLNREFEQSKDCGQMQLCRDELQLEKLHAIAEGELLESEIFLNAYQLLNSPDPRWNRALFRPLRSTLRQIYSVESAILDESFLETLETACDSIPGFVGIYLQNDQPEYGTALAEVIVWLSDLGESVSAAKTLSEELQTVLYRPNLRVQASDDFLSSLFERTVQESVDVHEIIQGVNIRGKGNLSGKTRAVLVPNERRAEIHVLLESDFQSEPIARKRPATVWTQNTAKVQSVKPLVFSEEGFQARAARSRAKMHSKIKGMHVEGGPFVQALAPSVAQRRQPGILAESERRLQSRINEQFNATVDPQIQKFHERYLELIRDPMRENGTFPRVWDMRTDAKWLRFCAFFSSVSEPGAANPPPVFEESADLIVQLHQSTLNNVASWKLAGAKIEELGFMDQLQETFPALQGNLKRDIDQPPLTISFAKKNPVSFTFHENVLKISLRIDRFEREEQSFPGMDITLKYRIRIEETRSPDSENPIGKIVFEQVEAPLVFPPNFDPEKNGRLSGREQMIRNIILQRLENGLKKTYEIEPTVPGEQGEDQGLLVPVKGTAENGWFSLVWKWNREP